VEFKDYYKILGVEPSASAEDIKRAYKKLARKYHPDVSKEADAQTHFQDVSDAYDNLKNEEKRQEYDQLRTYVQGDGQRFQNMDPNLSFDDLLSSIFGHSNSAPFDGFSGFSAAPSRSEDSHHTLEVTLEEVYNGSKRQLRIQRAEGTRTINVTIPKGITAGKRLRLAGQGELSADGKRSDLYLEITFANHPVYNVEGRNLAMTLPVNPWEAALGAPVDVMTLGGKVSLTIPPNSNSGSKLRLKGRGLSGGDQIVILRVVNPAIVSEKQRKVFEDMKSEFSTSPTR
jgi:curved DNA-binding protein